MRESGLQFDRAYSSDSGRTIRKTMGIILEELGLQWEILTAWTSESVSGGSFDGAYDGDLMVDSCIFNVDHVHQLS